MKNLKRRFSPQLTAALILFFPITILFLTILFTARAWVFWTEALLSACHVLVCGSHFLKDKKALPVKGRLAKKFRRHSF